MNKEIFYKTMLDKANLLEIRLDLMQLEMFYNYMNLLIDWNKKINLTSIVDENDIIIKHFIDSITILRYIKDSCSIIDIGTGAGFPGIPLKIIKGSIYLTLADSLSKRINFLDTVISKLSLNNITTIHCRAEDLGIKEDYREKFDIAVSRAVAPLNILIEYMLPFVKLGGICICMKGPNIEDEIINCRKALELLGGEIEKMDTIFLPGTDISRNILIIKKVKITSNQYPRKAGVPSKKPIA